MKKLYRRSISGLMALLICFTTILGGGITAFAASSSGEVAKSYSIGFPRSGDANLDYSGTWGHDELHYMNGWTSGEATWMTTLHTIGSFDGPACYCIEPGVPRLLEKTYTRYGEDYWKNYPSDYNSTIDADTIKTLLGRIMQYGYQGNLSTSWRSQNAADADKMAHMMATQVLVWETVVGERDANFNHADPGSADAVKSVYRTTHPLYSRFSAYYDSIEASVQKHGRFFKLYMYTALAPIPLSTFAGEPSQNVGKSFIKSYCAVCLEGAVIVLSCIIFSLFASSPPVVNPDAAAVTQVWSYIGELLFNMLVLVGSVKMSDRIIREMMGL